MYRLVEERYRQIVLASIGVAVAACIYLVYTGSGLAVPLAALNVLGLAAVAYILRESAQPKPIISREIIQKTGEKLHRCNSTGETHVEASPRNSERLEGREIVVEELEPTPPPPPHAGPETIEDLISGLIRRELRYGGDVDVNPTIRLSHRGSYEVLGRKWSGRVTLHLRKKREKEKEEGGGQPQPETEVLF